MRSVIRQHYLALIIFVYQQNGILCTDYRFPYESNVIGSFKSKMLLILPETTMTVIICNTYFLINKVSKTKVYRSQRWKYTLVVAVQLYLTAYTVYSFRLWCSNSLAATEIKKIRKRPPVEVGTIEYIRIELSA